MFYRTCSVASNLAQSANAAESAATQPMLKDKAYRLFLLRALLAPRVALRWKQFIGRVHADLGAAPPVSRVLLKPLRSYLHMRLGPAGRFQAMATHHSLARDLLSLPTLRRLQRGERVEVARLRARKSSTYVLTIEDSMSAATQREAELVTTLRREGDEVALSRISWLLAQVEGELALVIGGLQGPTGGHKREVIDATRELYGWRPKDATLLAMLALAQAFGARAVHAVSDAGHILVGRETNPKLANYDEYWRERGAVEGGPFGFMFAPFSAPIEGSHGRDQMKRELIGSVVAFAEAERANPKAPAIAPAPGEWTRAYA